MGARVGNMIFSSGIAGKDPATNKLAEGAPAQARFAFQNLRTLLENGGSSLRDVGRLTVYVKDESIRDAVNVEWLKCFPDPHDRPARHTVVHELRGGMLLQLEAIAVVSGEGA
jgi:2-iminobutanoate/2-iminopropanoate deaminase